MATNPIQINIPGDVQVWITCNSHASFYQRVTLSDIHSADTVVFSGSGEGVPMKTAEGSTIYSPSNSRQGYTINALFEYSKTGLNGPFLSSLVQDPILPPEEGQGTFVTITSEDGSDSDNNDSYLIIFYSNL